MGFLSSRRSGKGPHLVLRGESIGFFFFFELQQQTWGSSQFMTGNSGTRSWGLREVQSPYELPGASQNSSAVAAAAEILIWS